MQSDISFPLSSFLPPTFPTKQPPSYSTLIATPCDDVRGPSISGVFAAAPSTKHTSDVTLSSTSSDLEGQQSSRSKADFVDNLVDMSASIIESIWPNSASSPHAKLLPLRRFIQEILRRSRTSFCTLQLALLYIVRLRSRLPPHSSRPPSTPTATLCGRRMFLSALIVAAKYLQDRNYSNRAWAKISSLPLCDVNTNEMEFLKLVDFELFVSHRTFASWSTMLMARTKALQAQRAAAVLAGSAIPSSNAVVAAPAHPEGLTPKSVPQWLSRSGVDMPPLEEGPLTPVSTGSPSIQRSLESGPAVAAQEVQALWNPPSPPFVTPVASTVTGSAVPILSKIRLGLHVRRHAAAVAPPLSPCPTRVGNGDSSGDEEPENPRGKRSREADGTSEADYDEVEAFFSGSKRIRV